MLDDEGWRDAVPALETTVRAAIGAALAALNVPLAAVEVSVLLTGDEAVRALNRDWRGRDAATNVLAFPLLEPGALAPGAVPAGPLGDIVVARGTVEAEAAAEGKTAAGHLTHLLVHGTLHLLGHDHDAEAAAARMEGLETAILARLGLPDPYGPDTAGPNIGGPNTGGAEMAA